MKRIVITFGDSAINQMLERRIGVQ